MIEKRRFFKGLAIVWATLSLSLAAGKAVGGDDCSGAPATDGDGWSVAAPAEVGLDPATLCAMLAWLPKQPPGTNVHSVLIARRGKLVFERYFPGEDQRWGGNLGLVQHGPDTLHDMRSISKSVVSLLVGAAIAQGAIPSVDAPIFDVLPPQYAAHRTPQKAAITLRHALTMSPGFAWNEEIPYSDPANSEMRMTFAPDPVRYVLEQPLVEVPGKIFVYSGGATQLLGAAIVHTTGKSLRTFAREALFEPLGVHRWEWVAMPTEEPAAASGLRLGSRDLLKIGQLVLDKGRWNGKQVVPAAWIEESTAAQIGAPFNFYGYQWWHGRSLVDKREVRWVFGVGYGGQRLYIVPDFELTAAVTAGMYATGLQRTVPNDILNRFVLEAVRRPN